MNRSICSTKGMWNLAKGPPSQGAVVQLPGAYSGHWPLGYPVGPPTSLAYLTPLVPGPKPQATVLSELQLHQPFLRNPGNAGGTLVLSFWLVLELPGAARINLLSREGPQEIQTSLRTV